MNHRLIIIALAACMSATISSPRHAAASPHALLVGSTVAKAVLKFFGKESAEEGAEYLAKSSSKEMIERITSTATREGGEASVEQVSRIVGKHGPEALSALDNAPSIAPVLSALDEIPQTQVKSALSKLAAGTTGRELAEAVGKHGTKALSSELKHPGIGMMLVRALGDDGAELAAKMTTDQAIVVGRHLDELAKLPTTQRGKIVAMFRNDTESMVRFAGDFVKANPGKSLFTVAATTVVLAEPERILGGDEIVFDADGNPIVVSKKGIAGRSIEATGAAAKHISDGYVKPVFTMALVFIGAFFALWLCIKLWHANKREKLKTKQLQAENAKTVDVKAIATDES